MNGVCPDAIATFTHVVFGGETGSLVAVRCFSEKGCDWRCPWTPWLSTGPSLLEELVRCGVAAAEDRRAYFVVPGLLVARSACASNVIATRVVIVDLDHGDVEAKREHLVRHLGEPTLEVASGGLTAEGQMRLHLYWRLTDYVRGHAVLRACHLRDMIAIKAGGDRSFRSPHQPIRVPGSLSFKGGKPNVVRILRATTTVVDIDAIERAVAAMPPVTVGILGDIASNATKRGGGRADGHRFFPACNTGSLLDFNDVRPGNFSFDDTMVVRGDGIDGITRFDAVSIVMGRAIRQVRVGGLTLAAAWERVQEYNATRLAPPFDVGWLRHDFERLCRRDARNHGGRHR